MNQVSSKLRFSIVVPLFNEEESAPILHAKIIEAMAKVGESFEVIFVDDASGDGTFEVCKELRPLTLIKLRRNSGQTAAMSAGIKAARGEFVVTLDGDLQNDPADIAALYGHLVENNLDVVSGWRKNRQDTFSKRFISRGANFLRKVFLNDHIHDSGCSLKIYRRDCFETVELYGEMHRFIPALLEMRGYKIGEREVTHHPRQFGTSKYGFSRTLKGFLDIFAVWFWRKFASRPMHLLGGIGVIFWLLGSVFLVMALYQKLFLNTDLSDTAFTLLALMLFFFGFNFIFMGILFDVTIKSHFAISKDEPWLVAERVVNE
jgi:glycosyltransferase involved in cell wall biosynthesis